MNPPWTSYPLCAVGMTEGKIWLDFDLKLDCSPADRRRDDPGTGMELGQPGMEHGSRIQQCRRQL